MKQDDIKPEKNTFVSNIIELLLNKGFILLFERDYMNFNK